MAFKVVIALALVSVVAGGYIPSAQVYQSVAEPIVGKATEEYDPHPQYTYSYGVNDIVSGDSKSQVETRDGDVVHGEYSLNDADGYRRTVKYTADPINGFNAVVHREPIVKTVVSSVPVSAPVHTAQNLYAAPSVVKTSYAPVGYAPVRAVIRQSPIVYSSPFYAYHH